MKKVIVLMVLLVSTVGFTQCRKYREYSPIQLSVNYGSNITLGVELLYQNGKNIVGLGYAGNVETNKSYLDGTIDKHHVLNETMYITYGRQIGGWVVGVKGGKQNNADWNKVITDYNSEGNPNGHTFVKDALDYTTMGGVYVGYCLSERFRLNLGADTFSDITFGFTAGF